MIDESVVNIEENNNNTEEDFSAVNSGVISDSVNEEIENVSSNSVNTTNSESNEQTLDNSQNNPTNLTPASKKEPTKEELEILRLEQDKYEIDKSIDDKKLDIEALEEDINIAKSQLETLYSYSLEANEDTYTKFFIENTDNSQELADEVGVAIGIDDKGREILRDCFENRLRMSKTALKLAYSYIKNRLLEMKGVSQQFINLNEIFKLNDKEILKFEILEDDLLIYINLDAKLNAKSFSFTKLSDDSEFKYLFKIQKGIDEDSHILLSKFDGILDKLFAENNLVKDEEFVPTPYSTRYQINPDAVLENNELSEVIDYSIFDYDSIEDEFDFDIKAYLDVKTVDDLNKQTDFDEEELSTARQSAYNLKAATSLTEPIVYFFDPVLNVDSEVIFVNVKQVLNDKFLGKILPPMYEFIASNSERAEVLNFLALDETITLCNDNEKLSFCLKLSCRLITNKKSFNLLLKKLDNLKYSNLVLAFDAENLQALKKLAIDSLLEIRDKNVQILIDGIANASMKILTDYPLNYLRLDSRYYKDTNKSSLVLLETIINFCKYQGITSIVSGPETIKEARYYLEFKCDAIEGFAITNPKRILFQAVKDIRKLPKLG